MRIELPEPHINQQVILDSSARFRVVMCGRRFGKSELSQIEIISHALRGYNIGYNKAKETLYTEEQLREGLRHLFMKEEVELIIQSFKQPKKD